MRTHPPCPLQFHSSEITGLQFTADGSELITCSLDGSVCVWDASTGAQTGLFVGDCGFTCCWYDGGLEQLAVGTDRGIVHSLDLALQPRSMPAAAFASPNQLPEPAAAAAAVAEPQGPAVEQAEGQAAGQGAAPAGAAAPSGSAAPSGDDRGDALQQAQHAEGGGAEQPAPAAAAGAAAAAGLHAAEADAVVSVAPPKQAG